MIIIGLTGSIGMGKTTTANLLLKLGVPVHSADATVHKLLGPRGKAVSEIAKLFPGTRTGQQIDRKKLAQIVYSNKGKLKQLEAILHPMVHAHTAQWLKKQQAAKRKLVVLDIPLLFEASRTAGCDAIWVVSAAPAIQKARVLARRGMTVARFKMILRRQLSDAEKRKRADVVIPTGDGVALTNVHLHKALRRPMKGSAYKDYWKPLL
jgi:dephospho-CoA kinase